VNTPNQSTWPEKAKELTEGSRECGERKERGNGKEKKRKKEKREREQKKKKKNTRKTH
jgi:hypothetical protein